MQLLLLLVFVQGLWAQGSGSIATPPSVSGSDGVPFRVTRSVTGVVRKIDAGSITVEDRKSKKAVELTLGGKIRVTGTAKKLEDVVAGSLVRINYAADDKAALDIRILGQAELGQAEKGK
jgi:hypothetical protein